MTLILTCLMKDHIVMVADRRLTYPDGRICDDDTNKAILFNGKVAVAYTGLAKMGGKPTAEWIGCCMKDATDTDSAMRLIAERADSLFSPTRYLDKRLAVVATGWAMYEDGIVRPFVRVASNFLTEKFEMKAVADPKMVVQSRYADENAPFTGLHFGQGLTTFEVSYLSRFVRRAVQHGATSSAIARILHNVIYSVASGQDARAARVSKGVIIQILSRKAIMSGNTMFVTPLDPDVNSFLYISNEMKTNVFQGPIITAPGLLLTKVGGAFLAPDEEGPIMKEIKDAARKHPIKLPVDQIQYSEPCPSCAKEAKRRGSDEPENLVTGELPLAEKEAWVHCRGNLGHLLLVQRDDK